MILVWILGIIFVLFIIYVMGVAFFFDLFASTLELIADIFDD